MDKISGKLTVYYDGQFWIGVFERETEGKLSACRVVFGAEPREADVLKFALKHYNELEFSACIDVATRHKADNPKRRSRIARRQMQSTGIGTRSQQALKLQHEQRKTDRKRTSKEQRDAEKQKKYELKQKKRKEKKRGH